MHSETSPQEREVGVKDVRGCETQRWQQGSGEDAPRLTVAARVRGVSSREQVVLEVQRGLGTLRVGWELS